MIKIPKKVKIGGITYQVKVVDHWPDGNGDDGETTWCHPNGNTIFIRDALTQEAKEIVFIHEVLHAMNSSMNHEHLDALAHQLHAFLKENKIT